MPSTTQTALDILVVDDHEAILSGTLQTLEKRYPDATVSTAISAKEVRTLLEKKRPDVLIADLDIPEERGGPSSIETGICLLRDLMRRYPELNIAVQSAHIKSLVRLKPTVDVHQGGFTIADKSLPIEDMLTKVDWALSGVVYIPRDMRNGLEMRPEWLEMLRHAFQVGLQDKAIAREMNIAERTVRNYWTRVQDALNIYPEAGKNMRIQTEIRAREEGLID